MHKRLFPIAILTGALIITALIGYLVSDTYEEPPVRILLENKGGKVLFSHQSHMVSQDQDCGVCHHTSGKEPSPPQCTSCHVKKIDEAFIATHQDTLEQKQCAACHHPKSTIGNFSHENHTDDYVEDDCRACHHDESIEPEPQACSNCHGKDDDKAMPSLKKANHTRCAGCHEEMYQEGIKGCRNCHTRETSTATPVAPEACSRCHDESADQIIPTTTKAFHGQCMTCHEKQGAGPFGDEACGQCHMK